MFYIAFYLKLNRISLKLNIIMKKMFRMVEINEKDFINIIEVDGITVSEDKNSFQEGML